MTELSAREAATMPACVSPRIGADGLIGAVLLEDGVGTLVAFREGAEHVLVSGLAGAREDSGILFDWDVSGIVWVDSTGALQASPAEYPSDGRVLWAEGRAQYPTISPDGNWVVFVGETATTCRVMVVPREGVRSAVAVSDADFAWDPTWSPSGDLAWHEWDSPGMPWGSSRIMVSACQESGIWGPATCVSDRGRWVAQPRFSRDGALGALIENNGWLNLATLRLGAAPVEVSPESFLVTADAHEHGEPNWSSGQRSWAWDANGGAVINANLNGWSQLCRVVHGNEASAEIWSRGWHTQLDHRDGVTVALRSGARTPSQLVRYDVSGNANVLWRSLPDEEQDREPSSVIWDRDGRRLHGLLWHPPKIRPVRGLIVQCHGGPTGASNVTYKNNPRFWTSRGWSVFQPNPSGSSGGGRELRVALDGLWGQLDVDEVLEGTRLVYSQLDEPGLPIVSMGSSAGGMLALLLADRWSGRIAAVLTRCPVTDPRALADGTSRFEMGYGSRMSGSQPPREAIPIEMVGESRTPVFIAHGTADSVVSIEQSRAYTARARAAGRTVELMECEGEGHSFSLTANKITELERSLVFVHHHAR
ncbi:MAG: prolyl oligopeptidase family serine peptidase [Acidimicrobiia bacterium]